MTTKKHPDAPFRPSPVTEGGRRVTTQDVAPAPFAPHAPAGPERCHERGCIFPVNVPGERTCALHRLAETEPKLFLSLQPSSFLLDQAKFGIPEPGFDYSRARDRRRLAVLREQTLEEVA